MKSLKEKVIEFLLKLNTPKEDQFNTALNFYRDSPEANAGLVRHYNVAGFNKERLDSLIYDLKQAYGITAKDLTSKGKVVKMKTQTTSNAAILPKGFPTFSKGTKGNSERRAYLKEHGLKSASKKSADMDEVIKAHLKAEAEKVVDEALVEVDADNISKENETDISKNDTNVSKNETIVPKSETDTADSEKK